MQTGAAILTNPRYTGRQVWQRQPGARSRPRGAVRVKSRYVREGRLLEALPGAFPGRESLDIVRYLRANDPMIVCDRAPWRVASAEDVEIPASVDLAAQLGAGLYRLMEQFCVRGVL